jgi:anti-sigma B factor antagonist
MIQIEDCEDNTTVLRLSGDLDLISSFHLRHVVYDILEPGLNLVIDLRQLRTIDAVGLSALIGSVRRVRASGGRAHVTNAKPRVRWLFQTLGVEQLVEPIPIVRRPGVA